MVGDKMNKFMFVLIVLSTVSTAYSQTVVNTTTKSTSEVDRGRQL